ncbi:hypothetical protein BV22DRAFT_835043 [Leucogyrophana mollusca]|uniref:Uncharacterized protein n=1 Tax=Leucogyrophana mollusca TaxID=85980 RepID=A0ACB8B5E1_9AGAM|nr:hypothetical protein BV22DRAFT_835043 [Leucogyrophana mollusca]
MLQGLPYDILVEIASLLPTRSMIHLRQVSKLFQQLSYDRSVWAKIYRSSSLLRPPGPFTWQSAQFFEQASVRSSRLHLNWPPNPKAKPVASRTINVGQINIFGLLSGRWMIMLKDHRQIRCYDLDAVEEVRNTRRAPYTIVYETSTNSRIDFFKCASAFDGDGQPLGFVVTGETTGKGTDRGVLFVLTSRRYEAAH